MDDACMLYAEMGGNIGQGGLFSGILGQIQHQVKLRAGQFMLLQRSCEAGIKLVVYFLKITSEFINMECSFQICSMLHNIGKFSKCQPKIL